MLDSAERQIVLELAAAKDATFVDLVRIAGLDPATAFRGADLRGVDFSGCDLKGFDFTDADLNGASFQGASIKGAVFNGKSQQFTEIDRSPAANANSLQYRLNGTQRRVLQLMLDALDQRGRALALMPLGTGKSLVLCELIARSLPPSGRAVLIVTSAAEREQMIEMLRSHLPRYHVMTTKEARDVANWAGIIVHSASAYDNNFESLLQVTSANLDLQFCTSLERFLRWQRASEMELAFVRTAVFDTPLLPIHKKDSERQATLVHKLFGEATVEIGIEHALESGQLIQARVVQPLVLPPVPPKRHFLSANTASILDQQMQMLDPVAKELGDIIRAMAPVNLLVLCADAHHAQAVEHLLNTQRFDGGLDIDVRRAPQRWSAEKIVDDLEQRPAVLVTGLSRHSIDAARKTPNVAVLTPMRLGLAQELAFRPKPRRRNAAGPLIIDLANAFDGFPNLERVMQI